MKNKIFMSLLGFLLLFTLAACGNSSGEKLVEDDQTVVAEEQEMAKEDDLIEEVENEENEAENRESDNYENRSIGLTEEQFIESFNEEVEKRHLDLKIGEYEWSEFGTKLLVAEAANSESNYIAMATYKGAEELKGVSFESFVAAESRQSVFDGIQAIIASINPDYTEKDIDETMAELDFTALEEDAGGRKVKVERDNYGYFLSEDEHGYLEFFVFNKDDDDTPSDD